MFTGIIETLGVVKNIVKEQENVHLTIQSDITNELKVDQSIAHNGVCLTVVAIDNDEYTVTAIKETLDKTNIGRLKNTHIINLERAMKMGDRLDGHIVQGHVDETGICKNIKDESGSTLYTFQYNSDKNNITIEKGSITVNGVSLTVVNSKNDEFSVAIIPYTKEHTTFKTLEIGEIVNLEFDVIGKYVARLAAYNN
ncbi:riboflavin synthase alpha chain [Polaribacter sp. Hel1_33_78]|jgi:riboflavin synthase|uniref:riboflavin synthase n=1 Tax=unclassified Polaribacter TaxID=196858 RepID=UPI00087C47B8|nr:MULTISPECIES: riboflavin synthase [unclassified Polaribacter]MBT4412845.1 riboflavin synthase [Polaribacter sp.]MBT7817251.1 riboflavin synthase [Polaribacter sp.]MDG1195976.1 riboflavin synthase [Polaribacter sp.]MDG1404260.1 riboflavin synthase [Polaribacter sp.]SDU27678.1 riboflavin synthase alpha chain [Polaribacter sp. Hel1_33_78]